jgi:uncharacterized radical SAM superfamily protein
MRATEATPKNIFQVAARLKENGCEGILITGGCAKNGVLPALPYIPALSRIRKELGLKIALHTKFLDRPLAESLAEAQVDRVMIDVVGSEETLRSVFHIGQGLEIVTRTLSLAKEYNLRVAPHLIIGLHYGRILGEAAALEMLRDNHLESLVLVIIVPLRDAKMRSVAPPPLNEVEHIFTLARDTFPETPLLLGCARPSGKYQISLEEMAIRHQFDGIAYPMEETVELCRAKGIEFTFSPLCCAFCIYEPAASRPTSAQSMIK